MSRGNKCPIHLTSWRWRSISSTRSTPIPTPDALATPGGLADWLSARGLLSGPSGSPSEADRQSAIELREALRSLMLANNGGPSDDHAVGTLERVARAADLCVHFNTRRHDEPRA